MVMMSLGYGLLSLVPSVVRASLCYVSGISKRIQSGRFNLTNRNQLPQLQGTS